MAEEKIYQPETIDNNPLPGQSVEVDFASSNNQTKDVSTPTSVKDHTTPSQRVAVDLIGASLNTQSKKILAEFQFTQSGAIKIGAYTPGVSGDIRISPNGITARNEAGVTTFTLDGTTGNATFAGTIQAGTLVGGKVAVGDGDILIDGEEKRLIFYDPDSGLPSIIIGNA